MFCCNPSKLTVAIYDLAFESSISYLYFTISVLMTVVILFPYFYHLLQYHLISLLWLARYTLHDSISFMVTHLSQRSLILPTCETYSLHFTSSAKWVMHTESAGSVSRFKVVMEIHNKGSASAGLCVTLLL